MQQPTKIDFLRHSLTYGAITGAAMALASFLTELVTGKVAFGGLLIYVVMSIGILIGQKAWTMLLLPNKTSFMQSAFHGFICGMGASLINSLYLVIDLKFLHTTALDTITEQSIQMIQQMQMLSEQDIQNATSMIETLKIPMTIISYLFYNMFISALFSAISAGLSLMQKK
ncbi:MAG: DUF4199 domain-containing protein [Bacteroidales bacterium]|nr:DUF4199 domain-containing protein [Bacteroidales bacterium]